MKSHLGTLLLFLFFASCQPFESELTYDIFFEYHGADAPVQNVINNLVPTVSQEIKDAYINQLGFPQWDYATYFSEATPTLFIPIRKNGKTTGLIKAIIEGENYRYGLIKRGELLKYGIFNSSGLPSANQYAGIFKHFDNKFGYQEFDFFETVTTDTIAQELLSQAFSNASWTMYEVTTCSVTCTSTDGENTWFCYVHDCSISYEWHEGDEPPTLADPGGGNGGGEGGEEMPDGLGEDDAGIDCASFDFANVNSNWQEAAVNNVHFFVRYFNAAQNKIYARQMFLERTLYIGFPRTIGNATITSGMAAQAAASAIQFASDRVHSMFIETPNVMTSTVITAFMNEVKAYVAAQGGRADFTGSNSPLVIPTDATYLLFTNGDCID